MENSDKPKNRSLIIIMSIVAAVLLVGVGVYFFSKKKKTGDETAEKESEGNQEDATEQKTSSTTNADSKVEELQKKINALLPSNYTKLTIDGILGTKTTNALNYVKKINSN